MSWWGSRSRLLRAAASLEAAAHAAQGAANSLNEAGAAVTSASDALAGQGHGGAPEDTDQGRASREKSQLDEFLAHLALQQLLYRLGARRTQEVVAVALSATAVALAIADVTVRASASQQLLAAVPAFSDHWWPPLLGLALSFACLLLSVRPPAEILLGPDPEDVRPRLDEAGRAARAAGIQASPLRLITWLLIDAEGANKRAFEKGRLDIWLAAGIVTLVLTLILTGLAYWVVGR